MPLDKDHLFFGYGHKLTEEQREYVDSIIDNQLTIVNAKAGTGKTTLAVLTKFPIEVSHFYKWEMNIG